MLAFVDHIPDDQVPLRLEDPNAVLQGPHEVSMICMMNDSAAVEFARQFALGVQPEDDDEGESGSKRKRQEVEEFMGASHKNIKTKTSLFYGMSLLLGEREDIDEADLLQIPAEDSGAVLELAKRLGGSASPLASLRPEEHFFEEEGTYLSFSNLFRYTDSGHLEFVPSEKIRKLNNTFICSRLGERSGPVRVGKRSRNGARGLGLDTAAISYPGIPRILPS